MRIVCIDETAPYPKPSALLLTCDGDHGLFPPAEEGFAHPDGFIAQHAQAMREGWRESFDSARGRVFFGPCCSGKTIRT